MDTACVGGALTEKFVVVPSNVSLQFATACAVCVLCCDVVPQPVKASVVPATNSPRRVKRFTLFNIIFSFLLTI